ncbi:MAG: helix-turn-helix domain-containing protein [Saprospiraceae bacterium]|nr:helix-turn-helix domain-containing protein [Candidatus Brachybacter algidus]
MIECVTVCLKAHDSHKANTSNQEEYINISEAAKVLSLSIHTIYGLVNKNILPYNKRGRRLYFSRVELTNWIKEGRRKTKVELEEYFQNKFAKNKAKS